MRFGVLQFPGSCDERDALLACERAGDARMVWHEETRPLAGIDAVVVPGGFSYGDYLRAGAIARFSPAMGAVAEFAAAGGPVLGICNGFQVLCEAGLLPGALLPNESVRFLCRQVDLVVENAEHAPSPASASRASASRSPSSTCPAATSPRTTCSTRWRRTGRSSFATRAGQNPNGSARRRRGGDQRGRQRDGPDATPRARGRPRSPARPTGCDSSGRSRRSRPRPRWPRGRGVPGSATSFRSRRPKCLRVSSPGRRTSWGSVPSGPAPRGGGAGRSARTRGSHATSSRARSSTSSTASGTVARCPATWPSSTRGSSPVPRGSSPASGPHATCTTSGRSRSCTPRRPRRASW